MVDQQQDTAIVLTWVPPAISTVLVALRSYSRYYGRDFGWDDSLMLVAWILAVMEAVATYELTIWTWAGYYKEDVPEQTIEEQVTGMKWSYANQVIYHFHMGAIRASIILFLFRLEDLRRGIQIALHTVFWFNIAYTIAITTTNIFSCIPVNYVFDKPAMDRVVDGEVIAGGSCLKMLEFVLASAALSILMDLIIIPIPTAMVWNLSMRRKTKIAVVVIMSLGWIATGVSVARFVVYYYRWQPDNPDRNHNIAFVVSVWESNAAMWAACVPALKRLLRRWSPRWFGHNTADADRYYSTSDNSPWKNSRTGRKRRQRTETSIALSSGRHSDGDSFQMRDLNPEESESQVNFIQPQSSAERAYSFKVGVSVDNPARASG